MTNYWIPNPGTGVSPVREGETLIKVLLRSGNEHFAENHWSNWSWSEAGQYTIAHYQVSPPRTAAPIAEPATMSADEVLIRAREAVIGPGYFRSATQIRDAKYDDWSDIQAILAFYRDLSKPLAEVAPHTAEDPDERTAYEASKVGDWWLLGDHPTFEMWRKLPIGKAMIGIFRAGKAAR